jgi:hypothetical protein
MFDGEPILSPMARRTLARQPAGVLMTLLLVLSLALGGRPCPMLAQAHSAPPSSAHDSCPDPFAVSGLSDTPSLSPCHDGYCPQATSHYGATDRHGSPPGNPEWPSPPLAVAGLLSPDWLSGGHFPLPLATGATGPPPAQRSRVLRL